MDTGLVAATLGAQAGTAQTKVAASILKYNLDAEQAVVAALLDPARNTSANLAQGVGSNLDIAV